MKKIGIVDYGVGNIRSITNALSKFDCQIILTDSKNEILSCDGIILPGVGAFKHAMTRLKDKKLDLYLKYYVDTNKPFLGICLGMQMLFEESDEFGLTDGLGFIKGKVKKFNNEENIKLPYIAWSEIFKDHEKTWHNTILKGLENNTDMYHVHSYYASPKNKDNILSYSMYNKFKYCSTVKKNNIYGCQYHPEKSAHCGLEIIKNFIKLT